MVDTRAKDRRGTIRALTINGCIDEIASFSIHINSRNKIFDIYKSSLYCETGLNHRAKLKLHSNDK
ncbi:MAG: hypothetical protein VR64_19265 [Desulfatitalea sp. BRH_c12]|nr:MAG: hypothetical protein VR64_19265 [Desulfatitalea sp. BRH_c12]